MGDGGVSTISSAAGRKASSSRSRATAARLIYASDGTGNACGLTSDRKTRANCVSARASTGPQTVQGGARAARNALRHGLSLPVCSNPALSEEVETLAREIAGPHANAEIQELARHVAEAQIDLRRVRYARHQLLSDALSDQSHDASVGKKA
jgi:hypothetical protein